MNFQNFAGNQFMNFFAMSLVEIPGDLAAWYLMDTRLGRRWSNSAFLFFGALFFLLTLSVPPQFALIVTLLSLVGRMCMVASFVVIYQIAQETFPTPLRTRGIALAGAIAGIFNLATPYLSVLVSDI